MRYVHSDLYFSMEFIEMKLEEQLASKHHTSSPSWATYLSKTYMVDLTPNHVTTANCLIMAVLCSINHYKSIYLLKICNEINYILFYSNTSIPYYEI